MNRIYYTKNNQHGVTWNGDLLIMGAAGDSIDDATWIESLDNDLKVVEANASTIFINYVPEIAPGVRHRAILKEYTDRSERWRNVRSGALLTDSLLVRGAITAMSWVTKIDYKIAAYRPEKYRAALSWLRTRGRFDEREALALFEELVEHIGAGPLLRKAA